MRAILFFCILPITALAQQWEIQPDVSKRFGAGSGHIAFYRMERDGLVPKSRTNDTLVAVKMPELTEGSKLLSGYCYNGNAPDKALLVVQEILPDGSRRVYADVNHDRDLRNDGPGYLLKDSLDYTPAFTLPHPTVPGAYGQFRLSMLGTPSTDLAFLMYVSARRRPTRDLVWPNFWLRKESLTQTETPLPNGQSLYLRDVNNDGIWGNSKYEQVWFGPSGQRETYPSPRHSPHELQVGTRIRAWSDTSWWCIEAIDTLTGKLTLSPSERPPALFLFGDKMKNYKLRRNDDTARKVAFDTLWHKAPYTLIDNWGTWCKGCIKSIPRLKSLHQRYGTSLQIVGITTDPGPTAEFLQVNPLPWLQLESNRAFNRDMNLQVYGTYWLLDNQGRLLVDGLSEIEAYLKEHLAAGKP